MTPAAPHRFHRPIVDVAVDASREPSLEQDRKDVPKTSIGFKPETGLSHRIGEQL
jgi:hypothetical protein